MKLTLMDSICNCSQSEKWVWTSGGTKTSLSLSLRKNGRDKWKEKSLGIVILSCPNCHLGKRLHSLPELKVM